MDAGFLGKIDSSVICLTAAILCNSLRCWRTGNSINNVAFRRASSQGKTNKADLQVSDVSGSLGAEAHRYPDLLKTASTLKGHKPPNEMIGVLERQIQTWDTTGEVWRGPMIKRIWTILKPRIKKEWGKRLGRTEGYSNDEDALMLGFVIDPELDGSEVTGGLGDAGRGDGWRARRWHQWANLGVLDDVALL